jgi:hypothetical protein
MIGNNAKRQSSVTPLAAPMAQCDNPGMIIGDRLRAIREEKKFSQGDVEKRSGLFRCYISRVENNHTVDSEQIPEDA